MDTDPPSLKRPRETVENDGAYIPDNGGPHTSIIFSLNDEKGALVNALKPFQVREGLRYVILVLDEVLKYFIFV